MVEFNHAAFFAQRRTDLGFVVEGLIRLHWHNTGQPIQGKTAPGYIECGCLRDRHPFPGDDKFARSTLAAARALKDLGGYGLALDNYPAHVRIAQEVLDGEGFDCIEVHEGNSVHLLATLPEFKADVILLDSDSDEGANALAELEASRRHWSPQPVIIVDDIKRGKYDKGKLVLEWATKNQVAWQMVAPHVAAIGIGDAGRKTVEEWVHWCPLPRR